MGIVKFAQFVVVEAKVAPRHSVRTAMLRDSRRHQFAYTPKPGFLYIRSRAISSRTNDNFDTYPAEELRKSYRSFVGKPVFVNHNNDDPSRGRGVVLDAVLHENAAPDGSPDTWVEVLMEVDAVRFPLLAKRILDGDIDRTSMGCNVMSSECSYCGKVASTPEQYCEHINNQKGRRLRRRAAMGGVESVLVHEICRGLSFFENSLLVDEPADPTAFFTGIDDSALRMASKVAAFKLGAYGIPNGALAIVPPVAATITRTFTTTQGWGIYMHNQDSETITISAGTKGTVSWTWQQGGETRYYFDTGEVGMTVSERFVTIEGKVTLGNPSGGVPCPAGGERVRFSRNSSSVVCYQCGAYTSQTRKGEYAKHKAGPQLNEPNCSGTGIVIDKVTTDKGCPVCGLALDLFGYRAEVPSHKPKQERTAKVAAFKTALGSEWDHGPTEPGPEADTRWEGVVTSGQGYQVVVLWREYADSMAALLSGVFKDPERAEEWAQKCRDLGAISVDIRPPAPQKMLWGSKTAYTLADVEVGDSVPGQSDWEDVTSVERKGHQVTVTLQSGKKITGDEDTQTDLVKTADYDEVHRGHPIETLRNQTCPVCKTQNSWDGSICTVCGYVLPPKPFRAPNTDVTQRVNPDEGWFDPDAKKADPFDPVSDRDTAMKGQKAQGVHTMAQSIAAAARQRLAAQNALAAQRRRRMGAEDSSWASPGVVSGGDGTISGDPVPGAVAPSETTEGAIALPDAQNVDVEAPGATPATDTAPDATADVTDVGGEIPAPAPMDVTDVEAPVAGATDVDPAAAGDERPNVNNAAEGADGTPLNASDWNTAARRSARIELENVRTAVRERIFSALRLAKLRIAVGNAEHNDELALARDIENGGLSNESINNEIKALGLVYSRQRQSAAMPTAPHQRSARRSPSMAGGTTPLRSLAAGAGQDDEALFEP